MSSAGPASVKRGGDHYYVGGHLRGENAAALNQQGGKLAKLMRELDGG